MTELSSYYLMFIYSVDCKWGDYNSWSKCEKNKAGNCVKARYRSIEIQPQNGGKSVQVSTQVSRISIRSNFATKMIVQLIASGMNGCLGPNVLVHVEKGVGPASDLRRLKEMT